MNELAANRARMKHAVAIKNAPDRLLRVFWSKVNVTAAGCWEWTGANDSKGYGRVRRDRKNWLVTRYVWTELIGPVPSGLMVLHNCDNPPCCNPDHLYVGDAHDNMQDLLMRHPEKTGYRRPSKLTASDVRTIRAEYGKTPIRKLAARFGVTHTHIWAVGNRRSDAWGWLDD